MTAATGIISTPTDLLADLLSASSTFQTVMGVPGDSAAARLLVAEQEDHTRAIPRAVTSRVSTEGEQASTTDFDWQSEYGIVIQYAVTVTDFQGVGSDPEDVIRVAGNSAGAILAEMRIAMLAARHLYPDVVNFGFGDIACGRPEDHEGEFVAEIPLTFTLRGVLG